MGPALLLIIFAFFQSSKAVTCVVNGKTIQGCQTVLHTPAEFIALSNNKKYVKPTTPPTKVIVGPGSKILFDFRDPTKVRDRTWFIDTTLYPSHSNFINAMGEWNEYIKDTTKWFRCDWQSYIDLQGKWYFGMTINIGFPVNGDTIMKLCKNVAVGLEMRKIEANGWLSADPVKQTFNQTVIDYCAGFGLQVKDIDDLFQGTIQNFSPLHTGEAYGILRMYPTVEQLPFLDPKSIPVFNFLPLDLGVVQGTITSVYQTTNSHVNLKSNERNTPNMILLNIAKFTCFNALDGKPVHLQVSNDGWGIEAATQAQVDQWYRAQVNREKWLLLKHDNFSQIRTFEKMCAPSDPGSCITGGRAIYGTKASSLGFLRNPKVLGLTSDPGSPSAKAGYNYTVEGFGIPMQFYVDFINYPANARIKQMIENLTNMEMAGEVKDEVRYNMSLSIREAFWNAPIPPKIINTILEACYEVFYPLGIFQLKLRSSSNAEDLPGFDGAGLYDSFPCDYTSTSPTTKCIYSAEDDAMIPDTLECALKGVYGSLFNVRAITERTFARFVHSTCAMGVAVNPRYTEFGKVVHNAVAITKNLEPTVPDDTPAYTFSIQDGDNDVTNPDPGTTAESTLRVFRDDGSSSWKLIRYATPVAGFLPLTRPILTADLQEKMFEITKATEIAYCRYVWKLSEALCNQAPLYWKKTGLDSEFKFVSLDTNKSFIRVINKQLREFSGQNDGTTVVTINGSCKEISPLFFPQPIPNKQLINIALFRTANQTATHLKGTPEKAINGEATGDNYNSALTAYRAGKENYWMVNFGRDYVAKAVRIFATKNGGNIYPSMNNFRIEFVDKAGKVLKTVPFSNKGTLNPIAWNDTANTISMRALRIVGLATTNPVLAFTEVQVWAEAHQLGPANTFPRAVRPTTPNPCVWEPWSDWGPCTGACGLKTQNRTRGPDFCRTNDNNASFEERPCGETCPVDCVGFWSGWSKCDCVSKRQASTFFVVRDALYNGKCPGKTGTIRTQACTPENCPVDCVGSFGPWDECSCLTSKQSRRFTVTSPAVNGGVECPKANGAIESQDCLPNCPIPPVPVVPNPVDPSQPVSPGGPSTGGSPSNGLNPVRPPTDDTDSTEEGGGTNVGAVIGVAIGVFVGLVLLGVLAVHFLFPAPEPMATY